MTLGGGWMDLANKEVKGIWATVVHKSADHALHVCPKDRGDANPTLYSVAT